MRLNISRLSPYLSRRQASIVGACLVLLAGCAGVPSNTAPAVQASQEGLARAPLAAIDSAIGAAIAERRLPGAVFHLERGGDVYEQAYGRFSYEPDAAAVTPDTVFDAASLSKVLSTAPAVLLLAEDGKLSLDAKLFDYFPE